jgi:hypothetical protein
MQFHSASPNSAENNCQRHVRGFFVNVAVVRGL